MESRKMVLMNLFQSSSGETDRENRPMDTRRWGREMGGRFKREGIYVYLWLMQVKV